MTPYYLPASAAQGNGFVPYSERKFAKHRDLLVPHYRGGRWRGPGTKMSTRGNAAVVTPAPETERDGG